MALNDACTLMATGRHGISSPETHWLLTQYLYAEAELLDTHAWTAWGKLFAPNGVYWVPAMRGQTDAINQVSLVHDDALLREIRLSRLAERDATSPKEAPASSHSISNVVITAADDSVGAYTVRSRFTVAQQASWGLSTFHGSYIHELRRDSEGALKIGLKRVDLINVDMPLGDILTIL